MATATFPNVATDIVSEFLEVAFHSLLYTRQLYPAGVFERRKKYNVPVQMSCHPGVNSYLKELLSSLKQYIETGTIEQVVFCVLSAQSQPLERFVFEICPAIGESGAQSEDAYLFKIEQSLRAFLLKMNICDSMLSDLPEDCTWTVQVYTKESAFIDVLTHQSINDFEWIPADDRETVVIGAKLLPVKTLDSGLLKMQCYIEESTNKN